MLLKYNIWIGIGIISILFFAYDFTTTIFDMGMLSELNDQIVSNGFGSDVYSFLGISKTFFLVGQIIFELIPGIAMVWFGVLRRKQFKEFITYLNSLIKVKERKIVLHKLPNFEYFDTDKLLKYIRKNIKDSENVQFII